MKHSRHQTMYQHCLARPALPSRKRTTKTRCFSSKNHFGSMPNVLLTSDLVYFLIPYCIACAFTPFFHARHGTLLCQIGQVGQGKACIWTSAGIGRKLCRCAGGAGADWHQPEFVGIHQNRCATFEQGLFDRSAKSDGFEPPCQSLLFQESVLALF